MLEKFGTLKLTLLNRSIKMATTYTWSVVAMDEYPEQDGEQDVVFNVHWTLSGTDGTYTGSTYGSQGVSVDATGTFTPYADLTQEQVLGWIWDSGVDKAAQEASVAAQIENQVNPTVVSLPLPWAPAPVTE
jgi:hypothetical protein